MCRTDRCSRRRVFGDSFSRVNRFRNNNTTIHIQMSPVKYRFFLQPIIRRKFLYSMITSAFVITNSIYSYIMYIMYPPPVYFATIQTPAILCFFIFLNQVESAYDFITYTFTIACKQLVESLYDAYITCLTLNDSNQSVIIKRQTYRQT